MAMSPADSRLKNKSILKDRLQQCWNMDLNWLLFPDALREVNKCVLLQTYCIKSCKLCTDMHVHMHFHRDVIKLVWH